ncbi:unnamed protein product [Moneuplotes crassus]|uniref:Uncharacterized protein n=1 Tax=Euplotes crassus TaxID=5936 RepID=A0AAD1X810_EUPCR|nr:unnamed protein product [Moneuplotes crassus]
MNTYKTHASKITLTLNLVFLYPIILNLAIEPNDSDSDDTKIFYRPGIISLKKQSFRSENFPLRSFSSLSPARSDRYTPSPNPRRPICNTQKPQYSNPILVKKVDLDNLKQEFDTQNSQRKEQRLRDFEDEARRLRRDFEMEVREEQKREKGKLDETEVYARELYWEEGGRGLEGEQEKPRFEEFRRLRKESFERGVIERREGFEKEQRKRREEFEIKEDKLEREQREKWEEIVRKENQMIGPKVGCNFNSIYPKINHTYPLYQSIEVEANDTPNTPQESKIPKLSPLQSLKMPPSMTHSFISSPLEESKDIILPEPILTTPSTEEMQVQDFIRIIKEMQVLKQTKAPQHRDEASGKNPYEAELNMKLLYQKIKNEETGEIDNEIVSRKWPNAEALERDYNKFLSNCVMGIYDGLEWREEDRDMDLILEKIKEFIISRTQILIHLNEEPPSDMIYFIQAQIKAGKCPQSLLDFLINNEPKKSNSELCSINNSSHSSI